MTLQVSFDCFTETVKRLLNQEAAYVAPHASGCIVTSAKPEKSIVVASLSPLPPEVAKSHLKERGMEVFDGNWLTPEEVLSPETAPRQTYIAAVSYRSGGDKPGTWVDAYPNLPTQMTVLKTMYDEFRTTGELEEITFEEFVQLSNANVVIVTPDEIESFLRQKEDC